MTTTAKALQFHTLHSGDMPLILYNVWDAGSAQAVVKGGASAVATGSWSVAAAQGYEDGQKISFDDVLRVTERIVKTVNVPVSMDMECGYAEALPALADNVRRIIQTGCVGINLEDSYVGDGRLRNPNEQAKRIEIVAEGAKAEGVSLFINARTDICFQADGQDQSDLITDICERGNLYRSAGAAGLFVPGLSDIDVIRRVCTLVGLPLNIMCLTKTPDMHAFKAAGVSRISFGPFPYQDMMSTLTADVTALKSLL